MASITDVGTKLRAQRIERGRASNSGNHRSMRIFLIHADLAIIWISSAVCMSFRITSWGVRPVLVSGVWITEHAAFLVLYSILFVLLADARQLYSRVWIQRRSFEVREPLKAIALATLILTSLLYFSSGTTISRLVIATSVGLSTASLFAFHYWLRLQNIEGITEHRNVLIVGTGRVAQDLRRYLDENAQLGYIFKGYLDRRRGNRNINSSQVMGVSITRVEELDEIAQTQFIDEILITVADRQLVREVAIRAHRIGLDVRVIPDLYDGLAFGAPIEMLGQFPTMSLHRNTPPVLQFMFKRVLDVMFSTMALLAVLPLCVFIAIAIRIDSEGPIFYSSERVGKKGSLFQCWKFRTMVINAEALKKNYENLNEREGILFKIANDPRITRLGRLLRKYSLDEVPQFWNVLKGDMSLIGPRPALPGEFKQFEVEHLARFEVVPGISGLWQVEARHSPSFADYIDLDLRYVETWNLWLDCKLLYKTISVVLEGKGC